jgi:hypothetical protein
LVSCFAAVVAVYEHEATLFQLSVANGAKN